MSFQPVISLVTLPKTSDSFTVIDATPAPSPISTTGFGSPNAPPNLAAITSVYAQIQAYAESPLQATSVTGNLTAGLICATPIRDGVNILGVLYGEQKNIVITAISSDRLTLTTGADYTALLGNVYALSLDGSYFPISIKTITTTAITLYTPLPGAFTSMASIYRYYLAPLTQLVTNQADGKITADIVAFPILQNKCENVQIVLDDLLLKFSAQSAFANQNYAKAHEAARLITSDVTLPVSTCTTC